MINKDFYTPILITNISKDNLSIIKQDTINFINENKHKFSTAWRCPTLSTINVPREDNIQSPTLNSELTSITERYCLEYEYSNLKLNVKDIWVNVAPKGAYQDVHVHLDFVTKYLFSGVLYIDVDENSGGLRLINPLRDLVHYSLPNPQMNDKVIQPINGMLVSFPSWLKHEAQVNNSDKDRISISWNVEMILNENNS